MTDHDPTQESTQVPGRQRGVKSIDTAARLLRILLASDQPLMLRDIAERADIRSAQAHSYLNSLKKAGMVQQFGAAGRYGLGAQPLQLARAALTGDPLIRATMGAAHALSKDVGKMITVDLWVRGAPTAVLVLNGGTGPNISLRDGSRSTLSNSASAWVFAAWGDDAMRPAGTLPEALTSIRKAGHVQVSDVPVPGLAALSVPVLDDQGMVTAAISLIGAAPVLSGAEGPALRRAICHAAERIGA